METFIGWQQVRSDFLIGGLMRKVLGYGFRMEDETIEKAVEVYTSSDGLLKNKKEVLNDIVNAKARGDIHKDEKCKIFKVVVETV